MWLCDSIYYRHAKGPSVMLLLLFFVFLLSFYKLIFIVFLLSSTTDPVALNRDSVLTSSLKGAKWKPKGGRNQVGETKPPDIYLR